MKSALSITKLPALTTENLHGIMAERLTATKNSHTSIPILWQGLLEMDITVGPSIRTAKLYVPKDTPQGSTFVFLNVPEGKDSVSFLEESGWIDCADRYQLPIFAAESGVCGWKSPAEEQAYIDACIQTLFSGIYIRAGMSVYVVGYSSIGTCLHRYVLNTPLRVAAAVFVNASELEDSWLEEAKAASLDGSGMTFDIPRRDIPVPVWIREETVGPQAQKAAVHWLHAILAANPDMDPILGTVCHQTRESVCTPDGPIAKVCIKEGVVCVSDTESTEAIVCFLRQYARYNKFGPYGNALVRCIDYEKKGVDVRYFPDQNGDLRECLVYVPKGFTGNLPLVFAIHGSSESVRNYLEESLWCRKADKEGFIVVIPETALYEMPHELSGGTPMAYRPRWKVCTMDFAEATEDARDDLEYLDRVLASVITEYPVDEGRIYCTGHSNGYMMASYLASSAVGRRFAAVAVTSGVTSVWDSAGTERIPIYMTMGEFDLWSHDIHAENSMTLGIDLWLVRNGFASKETARDIRVSGASKTFTIGRHHCRQWNDRNGIPMIRYDWIRMKDHMNTSDENNMFWDQWFSKWTLDKEKGRCYEGTPIREGSKT